MDTKKIVMIILIAAIVCAAAFLITAQHNTTQKNVTQVNNTTNITKNVTNNTNVTNATPEEEYASQTASESSASAHESDPEFGTDEYVDRWDESQKGDDSWAYTHDQPVKSENGHDYKRMYNPDTEESYWYQMR
ncbi:hypothetical protein [uncultured Methanobrevibacter sp.]|uniref:hypothetical protein n=1 Tax=uncultured Methanobrevibacter sp. TaxID=253161 RepID=UPI0025CC9877|nr:hypothetical protein [uncultured Methanobrevibacter sp.]